MELVVVMLISGIILSLAGGVYLTWLKTYHTWQNSKESEQSLYLFENRLSNEVTNCRYIQQKGANISLDFENRKPICYQFEDSLVIRNTENITDTFFFQIENSSFRKIQTKQFELVDCISFTAILKGDNFPVNILKIYPNETLYNLTQHGDTD